MTTSRSFGRTHARVPRLAGLVSLTVAWACNAGQMHDQPKLTPYEPTTLFGDGTSAQHLVPGTMPRGAPLEEKPPDHLDRLATQGHEQFEIFCSPCHGSDAEGHGSVVQHGYPQPPSLRTGAVRHMSDREIFDVITGGRGLMRGYGSRVRAAQRWAIVAYVEALARGEVRDPSAEQGRTRPGGRP